ncbi:hypothetical protein PR202_ga30964 [Eleusine coracana subsp. coracana]|uniref:Disease resistance R13L4/SHOC-2-like LRR domain-containing protein n=1 Tax=Eleusine coracana subsp. coracana TaxID=191504 RepID=A0AAV5DQR3_ELECO|nr:hypothetical protein PR202_ga30964 [Eleusine coracana subsp. coracana]
MVLPSQIQRLQHLETLEFSGWLIDLSIPSGIVDLPRLSQTLEFSGWLIDLSIPSGIVDLPRLSHLIVPHNLGLPDGIGKLSSLCTLVGFGLLESSSENIRALGALTNLVDLDLTCSEGISFQEKESSEETSSECMLTKTCALSSALEKLSRLKQIQIWGAKYCRGDTLSSLSPPFHRLERLEISCVAFPRVPKWIGSLRDLRKLTLVVDEISNSSWKDVAIIGMLPSLVFLNLQITGVPAERIVITGFPVLKRFIFDCDGISRLSFEAGAMPNLWVLELQFHPGQWDQAAPAGLEHLRSLEEITATKVQYFSSLMRESCTRGEEAEKANVLIRVVFQEAVGAHPTSPTFTFQPKRWLGRLST